jgi:hypothetical protein
VRHGGAAESESPPFPSRRHSRLAHPSPSPSQFFSPTTNDFNVVYLVLFSPGKLELDSSSHESNRLLSPPLLPLAPSSNTASSSGPHPLDLSPLAAKDPYNPPERDLELSPAAPVHIAVPQPLYHPPASSSIGDRPSKCRGRPLFPFRANLNRNPDPKLGGSSSGSRLWNPINYVPRTAVVTPRPPQFSDENLPLEGSSRDAYPLLTIPEQRRSRQAPTPSSLAVERSVGDTESGRTSIALPRSQRRSDQLDRSPQLDMAEGDAGTESRRAPDDGVQHPPRHAQSIPSLRPSTLASYPSNAAPNAEVAEELAWGPAHPCFPHVNPHVPLSSEEYTSTRIIRIRRDWMVKGDLAPTFSNLYPEILDPLLPEQEFRRIIAKINTELIKAFDPFSLRNWFDSALGLVTGWIWDDLGLSGIKSHLRRLEEWLDKWNREVGAKEGVRIWSLRRTAYMTLDIQIPDPKVGLVGGEDASMPGTRPSTGFGVHAAAEEAHDR